MAHGSPALSSPVLGSALFEKSSNSEIPVLSSIDA
jgi:hypothetical protein